MADIDNKDSTVRPTDKEESDYRLDGRETSGSQTANMGEQAKEGATAGCDNRLEHDTTTPIVVSNSEIEMREIEVTTKINAAIAAHNKMAVSRGEEANAPAREEQVPPYTKLSAKAQRLCRVADGIVGCMAEVEEVMKHFRGYVQEQQDDNKPLYKWARFDSYRIIGRATKDLDDAVAKFEAVHLPFAYVKMFLSRATQYSLSVSHIAVYAMGVMNEKSATCIDEIEESELSSAGKVNAQTLITIELKKLLKHCAKATYRVWAALDLLHNALLIDELYKNPDIAVIKDLIAESEARLSTPRRSWLWTATGLTLGAMTIAATGLAGAHLYGPSGFDLALKTNPEGMHSQVMDLVHRAQAVTNLTGEIYSIKLEDLGQRYKELEDASESHGLRIDNLVEALGVPNDEGTYFTTLKPTTPELNCEVPNDLRYYIRKISDDADRQMERLHSEMEMMRKNINRMDIRLTKRLDKVDRHGN